MSSGDLPDKKGKSIEQIDAEWQAHIRRLQAEQVAAREGITPQQVMAQWEEENRAAMRKPQPPPLPAAPAPEFTIESEMRGETIHYIEPHRRTSMEFYWTRGYEIHADSIKSWWYPQERRSEPVTDEQRSLIVRRVVEWARRVQGVRLEVKGMRE